MRTDVNTTINRKPSLSGLWEVRIDSTVHLTGVTTIDDTNIKAIQLAVARAIDPHAKGIYDKIVSEYLKDNDTCNTSLTLMEDQL